MQLNLTFKDKTSDENNRDVFLLKKLIESVCDIMHMDVVISVTPGLKLRYQDDPGRFAYEGNMGNNTTEDEKESSAITLDNNARMDPNEAAEEAIYGLEKLKEEEKKPIKVKVRRKEQYTFPPTLCVGLGTLRLDDDEDDDLDALDFPSSHDEDE